MPAAAFAARHAGSPPTVSLDVGSLDVIEPEIPAFLIAKLGHTPAEG
jgi:hypothetical protein